MGAPGVPHGRSVRWRGLDEHPLADCAEYSHALPLYPREAVAKRYIAAFILCGVAYIGERFEIDKIARI